MYRTQFPLATLHWAYQRTKAEKNEAVERRECGWRGRNWKECRGLVRSTVGVPLVSWNCEPAGPISVGTARPRERAVDAYCPPPALRQVTISHERWTPHS